MLNCIPINFDVSGKILCLRKLTQQLLLSTDIIALWQLKLEQNDRELEQNDRDKMALIATASTE